MGKKRKPKEKFKFGLDFQELILQYCVTDLTGFKILEFFEDTYFTSLYHQIIAYGLKKYYKKNKRVPEEPYLREYLRSVYEKEKIFDTSLTGEDQDQVSTIIKKIYEGPVSEPDQVIEKCVHFARYVMFKEELENVDIENFDSYELAIENLKKANNIGFDLKKDYGTFVVSGMPDRAHKRNISHLVNPTPWVQLNRLLNGGGLKRGNVIVFMGKEKRFKTGFLLNTARGYLRMRKKVFYADLENGEDALTTRTEQGISHQSQEVINSEAWDEKLLKTFRKYKRLGAELVIKRFPALTTTANDIEKWLDEVKRDMGITFDVGIIDYGLLMGSVSGKQDTFGRVSDSFLDIKNLAETKKLEAIYTAAHIKRDGDKRTGSKYNTTDIADCIDIPKHVDAIFGIQESEEEIENGVMRLEVIAQRNGMRNGNCLFWVNMETQVATEFNKAQVKEYRDSLGQNETGGKSKKEKGPRKVDL